jgi:tetratricopeptide (TPR) repeat protein
MLNLAISLVATLAVFVLGTLVAGTWIAGFAPAVLVLVLTYFLLARRTSNQLRAVMEAANQAAMAAGSRAQGQGRPPKLDEAREILDGARHLGRWQFLVEAQIEAQLGALDYVMRDFSAARPHLERAFSRNWMAQGMLAAIDFREGQIDAAVKRLEKVSLFARKEATYWGLYAYILAESKRQDEALVVLGRALKILPDNEALKSLQQAISNRKKLRMKEFGNNWYTFFPEQVPIRRIAQQGPPGRGYPMPRR